MSEKLTKEQFLLQSIPALRKEGRTGIHIPYSGVSDAFGKYYYKLEKANDKVSAEMKKLTAHCEAKGLIVVRPAKKGVMVYLADDLPQTEKRAEDTLNTILTHKDTPSTTTAKGKGKGKQSAKPEPEPASDEPEPDYKFD